MYSHALPLRPYVPARRQRQLVKKMITSIVASGKVGAATAGAVEVKEAGKRTKGRFVALPRHTETRFAYVAKATNGAYVQ